MHNLLFAMSRHALFTDLFTHACFELHQTILDDFMYFVCWPSVGPQDSKQKNRKIVVRVIRCAHTVLYATSFRHAPSMGRSQLHVAFQAWNPPFAVCCKRTAHTADVPTCCRFGLRAGCKGHKIFEKGYQQSLRQGTSVQSHLSSAVDGMPVSGFVAPRRRICSR